MWKKVCELSDIPANGGSCVLENNEQIAIFNDERNSKWYAVQNVCPHNNQAVLSRGLIGEQDGEPKIVCPLHKHPFSLKTGCNLAGDDEKLKTYGVEAREDGVYLELAE